MELWVKAHMINDEFEEANNFIDFLVENGAIEVQGIDPNTGEFLYTMTPKMKELVPELYQEHFNFINQMAFDLWQKGYVEIKFEEKGPLVMLVKDLDYKEVLDRVSYEERLFLENMINLYNGGII